MIFAPIHEFNHCHAPDSGEFCATTSVVPSGQGLPDYEAFVKDDILRVRFYTDQYGPYKGGYISVVLPRTKGAHARVETILVSSLLRGKGYGQRLYKAAVEEVQRLGYPGIRSLPAGRNEHSNAAWKRLEKTGRVGTLALKGLDSKIRHNDTLEVNHCHGHAPGHPCESKADTAFIAGETVRFDGKAADGTVEGFMDVTVVDPHSNRSKVTHVTRGKPYAGAFSHLPTARVRNQRGREFEAHHHTLRKKK